MNIIMLYEEMRRERWKAGREERGLAADAPFEGEPIREMQEEIADAGNYLDQIAARYPDKVADDVFRLAHLMLMDLFTMSETMKSD